MTVVIQKTPKANLLTFEVITSKDKLHTLIKKRNWKTTLISEEKTCYLYIDDKESSEYHFHNVYNFFVNFSNSSERAWNIDIKSFVTKNFSEEEVIQAISEGILYGRHPSVNYKTNPKKLELFTYYLITSCKEASNILVNSLIKLSVVNFARDLQDMPPNELYPEKFAETIKDLFSLSFHKKLTDQVIQKIENKLELVKTIQKTQETLSENLKQVKIEILDKKQIEKNNMGLLLAVNAGSHHEPRVVILRYSGNPKSKETLALVGKGITFDSGGYNLKSSAALETMKFDMSGAAVVCSSIFALVQKRPKINVVAIACLTENKIGGHATLTESVIKSMSGKTVEINNTDAEGRLVLADGITYAIEKEKATKIITVATLTGAVVLALGENTTGTFTNNREFYQEFIQATQKSHEKIWELPIFPENTKDLKENTTIADISNISKSRYMGSSSGAAFLQEFVNELPFIHCDIAGTAVKSKGKRGTGVMVKTLIELFNSKH